MNLEKTLIVVPVYNEWPHVMDVLADLSLSFPHILVIEDGSFERPLKEALEKKDIEYVCLPFNLGSWAAIQTGFKYALIKGYQFVVTFDGDGQHLSEEIPRVLEMCQEGYDIVIGCCLERVGFFRKTCWFILRKLSGLRVRDVTSGFRAYNRKAFKRFAEFSDANIEYQDVGVLLLAQKFGLNIAEVCTQMRPRRGGESKVFPNMASIAKYFLVTLVSILVKWK